jgi:uncharacterized protein (TIGR03437 family)
MSCWLAHAMIKDMDSHRFRSLTLVCSAILCAAAPLAAQAPSTNASLKGAYFVRYLGVIGSPNDFAASFAGTLTFDGNGNFAATGNGVYFNSTSIALPLTATGTYNVLAGGQVAISNPFAQGSATLFGGLGAGGIVVASSTESGYLDLFVAIPPSTSSSKATLSGTYHVGGLEFAGGSLSSMRNVNFDAAADGNGNLSSLSLTGSSTALNDATATQTIAGATYTLVSSGSGTVTYPAPTGVATASQLLSGAKNLYVSPDGSFFVAGSPTGWDIQVGIKAIATGGSTIFSGVYFDATLENVTGSNGNVYAQSGASNELPSIQTELYHQRVNTDGLPGQAYDYTFSDIFTPGNDGTAAATGFYFAVGAGGNYALQTGGVGDYLLSVWAKTPSYSGTGVFLNPTGVVNAASNSPFTAQLSPGEVISLYGTGFTSVTQPQTAPLPFPVTLGGVQVTMTTQTGTALQMPLYVVSPTQINAVVPYTAPNDGSIATIQVISNGTPSNSVQSYTGLTSPGIFTVPPGGVGNGAILHANFSLVNNASPAKAGETVQLFLTGLGAVSGNVNAGAAAPGAAPFATVLNTVDVFLSDPNGNSSQAKVTFQGLAPGLAGLYQVNFTIPTTVALSGTGVNLFTVEISMLEQADGDNFQATMPISK